jgi:hypothetical protein
MILGTISIDINALTGKEKAGVTYVSIDINTLTGKEMAGVCVCFY